jgi:hypothetical protein
LEIDEIDRLVGNIVPQYDKVVAEIELVNRHALVPSRRSWLFRT